MISRIAPLLATLSIGLLALPDAQAVEPVPGEAGPLSSEALANATYQGLEVDAASITLTDGRWQGDPYQPDSAVAPRVQLLDQLIGRGDVTGDGAQEAVVLINFAPGGTGQLLHLVLMGEREGQAAQLGAALVGDRVRVRGLAITEESVVLEVLQAGPRDASCCPGELATRRWRLEGGKLVETRDEAEAVRVTPAALAGSQWRLTRWDRDEPVNENTDVTFSYEEGRFIGNAGCNNFFASVTPGRSPGAIEVSQPGATRMACRDPGRGDSEQRFLALLSTVRHFTWQVGQLVLSYGEGNESGVLFFDPL